MGIYLKQVGGQLMSPDLEPVILRRRSQRTISDVVKFLACKNAQVDRFNMQAGPRSQILDITFSQVTGD